jgi:hypothetical protein
MSLLLPLLVCSWLLYLVPVSASGCKQAPTCHSISISRPPCRAAAAATPSPKPRLPPRCQRHSRPTRFGFAPWHCRRSCSSSLLCYAPFDICCGNAAGELEEYKTMSLSSLLVRQLLMGSFCSTTNCVELTKGIQVSRSLSSTLNFYLSQRQGREYPVEVHAHQLSQPSYRVVKG